MHKKSQILFTKRSIAPLVTFRILFGALMFFASLRFWQQGWIDKLFLEPTFLFKYYGFHWVHLCPDFLVKPLYLIMSLTALCIALGLWFRYSTFAFILLFSYFELLDATNYLNHHYLVILFGILLLISPAHRAFSLDTRLNRTHKLHTIPQLYIALFILQIGIVYTYAGIAKLNNDWLLHAMPLRIWLPEYQHLPLIGFILKTTAVAFVFSWFAAFYDCTIFFFLVNKKTRPVAYFTVILFHTLTALFFNIGIFPLLMILSNLIFFSDHFHQRIYQRVYRFSDTSTPPLQPTKMWPVLLLIYFTIQIVVPLRHLAYTGNTMVTELGYRFGWRVMLLEKAGLATFTIKDKVSGKYLEVQNDQYLTEFQEKQMAIQPDFMLQYAQYLSTKYNNIIKDPAVYVASFITVNGRVSHRFIDPNIDLLTVADTWGNKDWIIAREL